MNDANIQYNRAPSWGYLVITVLLASLLTVVPVPAAIELYWPDWMTLVVFYWVLALPASLGVMFGWIIGLVEDVITFSVLGQHALGKALIGTVAAITGNHFRLLNFIQQILLVMVLQAINIAISATTNFLAFDTPVSADFWWPALTTALIWLPVSFLMDQFDPGLR